MQITTPAFENTKSIPADFTCDGYDVNPALEIQDVPEGAQSLVLIMDDPDSPTGTWVHWTMWNINPMTQHIEQGEVPEGVVQGQTTFGKSGYGGPCPGSGTHRYFFKLYALNTVLVLPEEAGKQGLEMAMQGHIMEQCELMGTYKRV